MVPKLIAELLNIFVGMCDLDFESFKCALIHFKVEVLRVVVKSPVGDDLEILETTPGEDVLYILIEDIVTEEVVF